MKYLEVLEYFRIFISNSDGIPLQNNMLGPN